MMTHLGVLSRQTRSWLLAAVVSIATTSVAMTEELRWFPGQYIVTEKKAESGLHAAAVAKDSSLAFTTLRTISKGTLLISSAGLGEVETASVSGEGSSSEPFEEDGFCQKILQTNPQLESCSPNYEVRALGTPNDPSYTNGSLWGLNGQYGIDAPRAWNRTIGSREVVVAVLDTGLDYTHPDLAANAWVNPGEIPSNGIDDDSNGYIDDVHGINAITGSGNPMDDNSHGTHVSGTIAGLGNNGIGVVGINHQASVMGLKFLNASGAGSLDHAIDAIDYMIYMKQERGINIRVANNSWGGGGFSQPLADAVERARVAGIIFAAAAGNEANDNDISPSYPAGYASANVVSVAAIDKQGNLANFSNYGQTAVSIAAPGVGIVSSVLQGGYASYSGTSMATPHVSGALALLFASEPSLDMQAAINRVYESGVQLSSLTTVVRTSRTLNVGRLLANEIAPLPAPPPALAPCHYTMSQIPFAPDQGVLSAPVRQRADEGSFSAIDLPWETSLYRTRIHAVAVSPNGVIYARNPGTVDFKNDARAPASSIAALHTDLIADATDQASGLRYSAKDDVAWFYWKAKHYHARDAGYVNVWAALHRDGRIRIFTKFDDESVTQAAQKQATIGLAGSDAGSFDTFAYNSTSLQSEMGVEFLPQCDSAGGGSSATVTKISAVPAAKGRPIVAGGKVQLRLHGAGSGDVALTASIDGFSCSATKALRLSDGRADATSAIPRTVVRSITFAVGSVQKVVRLKKGTSRVKVKAARAAKACDELFSKLR